MSRRRKISGGITCDPYLWQDPKHKTFYAMWQEEHPTGKGTVTRRRALCAKGRRRATKDPREARRLLNNLKRDLWSRNVTVLDRKERVTLEEFHPEFISYIEGRKVRPGTVRHYEDALRAMKDTLGEDMPMSRIEARDLDRVITDLSARGLAAPTINKYLRHMLRIIRRAFAWGYTPVIDRDDLPRPLDVEHRDRFLMLFEIRMVLAEVKSVEVHGICIVSLYSGLRSGEVLALTFADVDNPPGFLRISCKQKNRTESRIPINEEWVRPIIENCRKRVAQRKGKDPSGNDRLFRPRDVSYISKAFKEAVRKARKKSNDRVREDLRFHDLRHTYASYLAMQGEAAKTVQDLMRHKSIVTTQGYMGLLPTHLTQANAKLNFGLVPLPEPAPKRRTSSK